MRCPGASTHQRISEHYSMERTRRRIPDWPHTSLVSPREPHGNPLRAFRPSCRPGRKARAQIRSSSPPPPLPCQAGTSPSPKRCPCRRNSRSIGHSQAVPGRPPVDLELSRKPGKSAAKPSTNTRQPAPRELAKSQPAPVDVGLPQPAIRLQSRSRQSKSCRRTPPPTKVRVRKPRPRVVAIQMPAPVGQPPRAANPFQLPYVNQRHLQPSWKLRFATLETQVRILAASTPDRGEVAFAVQLKPAPQAADPAPHESLVKSSRTEGPRPLPPPAAPLEAPSPEPKPIEPQPIGANPLHHVRSPQPRIPSVNAIRRRRRRTTSNLPPSLPPSK